MYFFSKGTVFDTTESYCGHERSNMCVRRALNMISSQPILQNENKTTAAAAVVAAAATTKAHNTNKRVHLEIALLCKELKEVVPRGTWHQIEKNQTIKSAS